jgi:hypothetical protein
MPVITAFGGGGGGGKKSARAVIGSTGAGYTASDVDFLCNGSNDSAMFDAALAAIPAAGGEIKILDGTYTLTKPWVIERNNIKVTGSGARNTALRMTGARDGGDTPANAKSTAAVIYVSGSNNGFEGLELANDVSATTGTSFGIYIIGNNNTVTGNIVSNSSSDSVCYGLMLYVANANNVTGNTVSSTGSSYNGSCYGICLNTANANNVTGNTVSNSNSGGSGNSYGIYATSSNNSTITGNTVSNSNSGSGSGSGSYGIYVISSNNSTVTGNTVSNSSGGSGSYAYGIYLINATNSRISNVFGGKTASFNGFALYISGTGNTYTQISCNIFRNWVQYGTGALTVNGTAAASLGGSSTVMSTFTAIGTGSTMGFNTV